MKTQTQIFTEMDKNNFMKLKHILIGSANYTKHEKVYWLTILLSYIDSRMPGLCHLLKADVQNKAFFDGRLIFMNVYFLIFHQNQK
jgi:hypothetical protein